MRDEIGGRGVVHGYGMTEVPMIANGSPHDTDEQLANTDGKPVEGADVRIVRLDGRDGRPRRGGRDPGPRADGLPRLHRPGAHRRGLRRRTGYFRTGDLGKLRADGHLVITGRLKDVIVRKGENISATEVEAVLYKHPKVAEVAVIGLPDPERGERVCAVVQLVDGADALSLEEVAAFCREAGLMTQKTPEQVELRTDWPRAGTGKIVKKALREEYAGSAPSPAVSLPPSRARPGPAAAGRGPGAGDGPYRICFVCTGNICRSPMADVVLRHLAADVIAGTRTPSPTCSRCRAPAPGRGTRASPWTGGPPGALAARATGTTATGPPTFSAAASTNSTWWWHSTAGTSRRCAAWPAGARSATASSCCAPSTPTPAGRWTCRTPTTTTSQFAPCLAMVEAGCRGLTAALADALVPRQVGGEDGPPARLEPSAEVPGVP